MEHQTLLYDTKLKLPEEIWNSNDVDKMIQVISNSNDYLKNNWGEWMKARDKLIIKLIFEQALRPKEALRLKFEDFDLKRKTIRIRKENNKIRKERLLPINEKIIPLLVSYVNFPRYLWKGSKYLFPSFQNKFLSSERFKHIFREKVIKPLGLWKKPTTPSKSQTRAYTLRHSKATELINKTGIYTVANILGHSDIRSTKVYLHLNKAQFEHMRNVMNS